MQKTTPCKTGFTASAFLLIGTLAVAQSTSMTRKKIPGRTKSSNIVVTKADRGNASGATTPQATATEHKNGAVNASSSSDRNSAHATESLAPANNVQQGKNPLYEDKGKSGTNPLYESGKDSIAKPGTPSSGAAGYKDGEAFEMKKGSAPQQGNQGAGSDAMPRKHIAGVKYEDISATNKTGGANPPGFAVNEQGSGTATNTGKKHPR